MARRLCWAVYFSWLLVGFLGCNRAVEPKPGDKPSGATAGDSGGTRRMILLTNGDDPFWDAMREGMKDGAKDLKLDELGLVVEMDKNDGTSKGQIDKLKQYAGQTDVAAVAISITDNKNVAIFDAMKALRSQGVEVITVDSDVDRKKASDTRFAYIGTDNIIGGHELGRAAKGLKPEGGKYAAFVGIKTAANAQERSDGFAEAAGEKWERVDYLGDEMDLSTAQRNVRDVLDRHPNLDALVGIWSYNAHAIADTIKDRNLRPKLVVVNFDAAPKALAHMEHGLIDALVVQNPYEMGLLGTKLMTALVQKDHAAIGHILPAYEVDEHTITKPGGDIVITGLKVVVPDGDKRLSKEMFEKSTEFLTLSEFKAWLAKYKLIGS